MQQRPLGDNTEASPLLTTLLVVRNVKLGEKGKIKSKLIVLCFRMSLALRGRKLVHVWVRRPVHR